MTFITLYILFCALLNFTTLISDSFRLRLSTLRVRSTPLARRDTADYLIEKQSEPQHRLNTKTNFCVVKAAPHFPRDIKIRSNIPCGSKRRRIFLHFILISVVEKGGKKKPEHFFFASESQLTSA